MQLKHGPNFSGFFSYVGMFMTIISIFIVIYIFDLSSVSSTIKTIGWSFVLFFGFNLFLGFEGVQIDFQRQRLRHYHRLMGFKLGAWKNMNEFDELVLMIDRFQVRSGSFMRLGGKERRRTFDVVLTQANTKEVFLLVETMDYKSGLAKFNELAEDLDYPMRNNCLEEMKRSKKRRKNRKR